MPVLGMATFGAACALAGAAFVAWIDRDIMRDLRKNADRRARQATNMAHTIRALRANLNELHEAQR